MLFADLVTELKNLSSYTALGFGILQKYVTSKNSDIEVQSACEDEHHLVAACPEPLNRDWNAILFVRMNQNTNQVLWYTWQVWFSFFPFPFQDSEYVPFFKGYNMYGSSENLVPRNQICNNSAVINVQEHCLRVKHCFPLVWNISVICWLDQFHFLVSKL